MRIFGDANYIIVQSEIKKSNSPRGELPLDVIPFQFDLTERHYKYNKNIKQSQRKTVDNFFIKN